VDEAPLLDDILTGGLYGVSDINRAHSSNITLEARASGRKRASPLAALFPGAEFLRSSFPYARKHAVLLPAAWAHRILRYLIRSGKAPGVSASESVRIGRERVLLLKRYGII